MLVIPTPNGNAIARTFGQKTSFSDMSLNTNGTLVVHGYNNDQVQALSDAFTAGAKAAGTFAGAAVKTP